MAESVGSARRVAGGRCRRWALRRPRRTRWLRLGGAAGRRELAGRGAAGGRLAEAVTAVVVDPVLARCAGGAGGEPAAGWLVSPVQSPDAAGRLAVAAGGGDRLGGRRSGGWGSRLSARCCL